MNRGPLMLVTALGPTFVGLVVAALLALPPLPAVTFAGREVAWCRPGEASESAVAVLLNPDGVNIGSEGQSVGQQASFENYCIGKALTRMEEAGAAVLVGGLVGL